MQWLSTATGLNFTMSGHCNGASLPVINYQEVQRDRGPNGSLELCERTGSRREPKYPRRTLFGETSKLWKEGFGPIESWNGATGSAGRWYKTIAGHVQLKSWKILGQEVGCASSSKLNKYLRLQHLQSSVYATTSDGISCWRKPEAVFNRSTRVVTLTAFDKGGYSEV